VVKAFGCARCLPAAPKVQHHSEITRIHAAASVLQYSAATVAQRAAAAHPTGGHGNKIAFIQKICIHTISHQKGTSKIKFSKTFVGNKYSRFKSVLSF